VLLQHNLRASPPDDFLPRALTRPERRRGYEPVPSDGDEDKEEPYPSMPDAIGDRIRVGKLICSTREGEEEESEVVRSSDSLS